MAGGRQRGGRAGWAEAARRGGATAPAAGRRGGPVRRRGATAPAAGRRGGAALGPGGGGGKLQVVFSFFLIQNF